MTVHSFQFFFSTYLRIVSRSHRFCLSLRILPNVSESACFCENTVPHMQYTLRLVLTHGCSESIVFRTVHKVQILQCSLVTKLPHCVFIEDRNTRYYSCFAIPE